MKGKKLGIGNCWGISDYNISNSNLKEVVFQGSIYEFEGAFYFSRRNHGNIMTVF